MPSPARSLPRFRADALAAAMLAVFAGASPALAQQSLSATYGITLGGFAIGRADLKAQFPGDRYRVEVQLKLTGLAGMLTGGHGGATSSGIIAGLRPMPVSYAITSSNGERHRTVRMALAQSNVEALDIKPPLPKAPDRVPLGPQHRRNVVDPVSALLMPVTQAGAAMEARACNRVIPVFDGVARFDVVLTYDRTARVSAKGYEGPALVCSARYVPIAGHRDDRKSTTFMAENRDMRVWLVPVPGTRILAPARIEVRTMIGMSVIEADRFMPGGRDTRVRRADRP
jgi:hypothetical protein